MDLIYIFVLKIYFISNIPYIFVIEEIIGNNFLFIFVLKRYFISNITYIFVIEEIM